MLLSVILLITCSPSKSVDYININIASEGCFSAYYKGSPGVKMKVAITYNNQTSYYDCFLNQKYLYAFIFNCFTKCCWNCI